MMEYSASLDGLAKGVTIVCFLLFSFLMFTYRMLVRIPPILAFGITMLYFIIFIAAYVYAPKKYLIANGMLIIVRPINKVKIPLSDIAEVRAVSNEELGTLIRTGGSGGLFGYYGNYRSTRVGKLTLYTTRRNNRIMITTVDDNRILISPDDISIMKALKG